MSDDENLTIKQQREKRRAAERAAAKVPGLQKKVDALEFKASKAEWGARVATKEKEEERERGQGALTARMTFVFGFWHFCTKKSLLWKVESAGTPGFWLPGNRFW